jgi:hypothetical protein
LSHERSFDIPDSDKLTPDDILIFSNNKEEHAEHLRQVLTIPERQQVACKAGKMQVRPEIL